jgi:hypothetical protein
LYFIGPVSENAISAILYWMRRWPGKWNYKDFARTVDENLAWLSAFTTR